MNSRLPIYERILDSLDRRYDQKDDAAAVCTYLMQVEKEIKDYEDANIMKMTIIQLMDIIQSKVSAQRMQYAALDATNALRLTAAKH